MSLKRLPRDDLSVAKPEGPRALALVSEFARLDPPDLNSPESDHHVPLCDKPLRDDAGLHILEPGFVPGAYFVVTAQPRSAGGLQLNLGVVQREKLVHVAPLVEEVGPALRNVHVPLRHRLL